MFRRAFTPLRAAARSYATAATEASGPVIEGNGRAFVEGRQAVEHHAAGSAELWRKITLYVACPAIIVGYLNSAALMKEHENHVAHMKEENGGELPERVVYDYFNVRRRDLPWGDYTPFYNPKVNIPLSSEE